MMHPVKDIFRLHSCWCYPFRVRLRGAGQVNFFSRAKAGFLRPIEIFKMYLGYMCAGMSIDIVCLLSSYKLYVILI